MTSAATSSRPFSFIEVCAGLSSCSLAWNSLGWKPIFFSEIAAFPSQALRHHHSDVPNLGDMTKFKEWPNATVDLLVGGTPCQAFSIAGLRKGLDDPRGNLTLTYLAIAERYRPRWVVWENVPGVLSDDGGRTFGLFLGGLAKLGYGFAYRILDAQFFGVPQRRRRVFVVGYLGDWRRAAAVLFESHSLSWDSPPSRKEGESVTGTLASRPSSGGGLGTDFECDGGLVANTLMARTNDACDPTLQTYVTHSLRGEGFDASEDGTGRGTPIIPIPFDTTQITHPENRSNPRPGDPAPSLAAKGHAPVIAFCASDYAQDAREDLSPTLRAMGHVDSHGNGGGQVAVYQCHGSNVGPVGTLRAGNGNESGGVPFMLQGWFRRLTPRECERLMGLPDDYTLIPIKRGLAKDGPRYKAIGNGIVRQIPEWIGRRIQMVEDIMGAA